MRGCCWVFCSGFRRWHCRRNLRREPPRSILRDVGFAKLRIAVVSPFVDRRHGTERALSELLERLAQKYGCQIHLYSERVEDLQVSKFSRSDNGRDGAIFWHRVPSVGGPHLLKFVSWLVLNTL